MTRNEKALARIEEALNEAEGGLSVFEAEGKICIQISTGRNFSLSEEEVNYQAEEFDKEKREEFIELEGYPTTPITRELAESYGFNQTKTTPDHDDRGIEFNTKWACLEGLYICNNEPCNMEMLEGTFYTDKGEEHYICIESKEELDALEACENEEEVLVLIEKWNEKFNH